jgi:DNA-binding NtrC family response regulator
LLRASSWLWREKTETELDLNAPHDVGRLPAVIIMGRADAPAARPADETLVVFHHALRIGRGDNIPDGDVSHDLLLPDSMVSAEHAVIHKGPSGFVLEDRGSTNGTVVDGKVVNGRAPLADGSLILLGQHALVWRLLGEQEIAAIEADDEAPLGGAATLNPALATIRAKLRKLARSEAEILLLGETGVGKEVHARAIHAASGRGGPFTAINCAALPAELLESELFGYERGAHSTAQRSKRGLIEQAHGGTLFLDEIGETPAALQSKLLRFLETREFTPLGSSQQRTIDVRLIAATNRPLGDEQEPGVLRSDLVARLGAEALTLPPLRERMEDLGRLVGHFMTGAGRPLSQAAWRSLCLYRWPRNVRELEKVVRNALVLAEGAPVVDAGHLPEAVAAARPEVTAPRRGRPGAGPPPTRSELEQALLHCQGNVAETARCLGRHTASVWRWLRSYGLDPQQFRPPRPPGGRPAHA